MPVFPVSPFSEVLNLWMRQFFMKGVLCLLLWENAFPNVGFLAVSSAWLTLWELRSSLVPVGCWRLLCSLPTHCSYGSHENLFLIHPCDHPAGKGVITSLWAGCCRWMPHVPQESQMKAWYGRHTVFSNRSI